VGELLRALALTDERDAPAARVILGNEMGT